MKNTRFIWRHMKGKRLLYGGAITCVALGTFIAIINPLILQVTIDSIIGNLPLEAPTWLEDRVGWIVNNDRLLEGLVLAGLTLIILTALNGIFQYFRGKWSAAASEGIAKNLRDELYNHLQHLPYDYHVKAKTGDLIQRCTSDVEQVRLFLGVQLVEVARAVFIISISFIIMLKIYVNLTLVAIAAIPLIIGHSYYFYILVKKTFKDADEAEARMSTVLQENLTGVRVVKAFARENYEIGKFEEMNRDYRDKVHRVIRNMAWYWSISDLFCLIQIAAVLVAGVYWTVQGEISLGNLVVFVSYESMLIWPVRQLGRILTDLGKMQVAIDRIQEILEEETEFPAEEGLKPEIKGEISFNKVSFAYGDGQPVLRNVSFRVKRGQTIAVLGPTGSGKSTLVHLLTRLYDCQGGSIEIDGYDIKEIDKKWLRKHVGLVLQEPFLFARTIKENIAFANPAAGENDIYEVARIAAVHEFIEEMEEGYDTPVGERGVSLSGGQKQRIAIARTLIRNCPILIFDDSLSAVDTETDLQIRKALQERSKETTTFIISHRINTLSMADLILVLEDGEIAQMGSHEELIRQEGMYRRIWEIQNSIAEVY
ncbi:MAG TPA: ABC transporter ATP-binding protein [Halanaerobiaceae bacterium]|nr:ABC transporter ATP-binding protein [Halanaerobiaceae bacterium]